MKYVIFSHYKRSLDHSVASTIYNVFLKKEAPTKAKYFYRLSDNMDDTDKENLLHKIKTNHTPDMAYVFNGLTNLGFPIFLDIICLLIELDAKLVVYWHESSWNLRWLRNKQQAGYDKAFALLKCAKNCYHWATNKKIRELIFFLTGCPAERVSVVYEVISPSDDIQQPNKTKELKLLGGGIPDRRKGVGYFIKLSDEKNLVPGYEVSCEWYASRPSRVEPTPADFGNLGEVEWKGCSKQFRKNLTEGDAFILTSVDDPCPIVALEALDAGLPVFCFSTVGTSEIIPNEFVADNYDELKLKIKEYFINKKPAMFFKSIAAKFHPANFMTRVTWNDPGNAYQYPLYVPNPESRIFENLFKELNDTRTRNRNLLADLDKRKAVELQYSNDVKEIHKEARVEIKRHERNKENPKKNTKVIIVGNSPMITKYAYGETIDNFDVVIRVNNFAITGYEKHVGTKTDKCFLSFACKPNKEFKKVPNNQKYLYLANLYNKTDKVRARLKSVEPAGCNVPYDEANKLSTSLYFYGLKMLLNLDKHQWPSTGLVATQWAFDMYGAGNVFIHGFSFFKESQKMLKHYFPVTTTRDIHHDFAKEEKYMRSMIGQGLIKLLPKVKI
jgi:glycosyltransferase involved in cell wall biosynthesis